MTATLLEIIATDTTDALAAERGGADRLELCRDLTQGGLTPDPDVVADIRRHVALPLRVMLRPAAGFAIGLTELRRLMATIPNLVDAGADGFVFGFLTPHGNLDRAAMRALADAVEPKPSTLHHAFDHARHPRRTWEQADALPGLDAVLTSGGPAGLPSELPRLVARTAWQNARLRWLVGGGVDADLIPVLRRAGFSAFHCGRAARRARSWDRPVDEAAVRSLRAACDEPTT